MLPGESEGDTAVTGAGEIVGGFSDSEATQKVLAYLSTSANNGLDPANAKDPILQETIKILQDPDTTFRFDASDLMPGAVGAGTFWKGMVAWVNGTSTDEVLTQIETGWPSS
jgi:alpha-glucoside transport system substrate-binding protein